MKVRLRYDSWFARLIGAYAITIYPFVFIAFPKWAAPKYLVEHEFVHVRQVRRLGWWKFYASYVAEYFSLLFTLRDRDAAYRNISYEREAYDTADKVTLSPEERAEIEA